MPPTKTKKHYAIGPVLRVLWAHTARFKGLFWSAVFFNVLVYVFEIVTPLWYKKLFDTLAGGSALSTAVGLLVSILVTILILKFASWLARRISVYAINHLEPKVMAGLTQTSFDYLLGHSYSFFVNNFSGAFVRRINRLPRAFEQIADNIFFNLLPLVITLAGILIVLFSRYPTLGLAFSIWLVVMVTVQIVVARWKQRYNIAMSEKDSQVTGVLSDAITNDVTIKLFNGDRHERSLVKKVTDELLALRVFTWTFDEIINAIQGAVMISIEFVIFFLAIKLWKLGQVSIGDFALLQAYLITAIDKVWDFGNVLRRMYEAFADATEMVDILNTPHEIKNAPGATKLAVTDGVIEFRNVHFAFHETRQVLHDFSLTVAGGEKIALVGPSGAGKTTVVKLLFRFFDVTENEVLIDGQNIAHVTQESLREHIALVPQEPILFHRTLMENIRYGRRDATDAEVVEAGKLAHCHEFISQFPQGYETFVGERGVRLSGGERQRVAIARAILKNAPILVLDEATSSLDSESESYIQEALSTLMQGKTVIVIAHSLSTIMKMDRIVVIEDGRVVATGTHQELLTQENGLYKKLWEIQAGGFIKD